MSESGWIGVDLDGTLAHYEGWVSIDHIGDPVPSIVQMVKNMIAAGHTVKIFTARIHGHGLMDINGVSADVVTPIQKWCLQHIGQILPITNVKDFGMVMLYDDRCIQVECNTGRLIEG